MKIRTLAAGGAAALALALVSTGSASAATEFGDTCAGNAPAPGEYTLTTLSTPSTALPLTAPSGGVITKVKVNNGIEFPFSIPTSVKVLRSTGGNSFTVIAQQTVMAGLGVSTADTRLPVQAGDRLGLHGETFNYEGSPISFSLYCGGIEGSLGASLGDVQVGASAEFPKATEGRVPLAAVIEPDADGDGYGDETQDKCPQSAAVQATACPVVVLDAFVLPKKSSVVVVVGASTAAPVTVSASVKLPNAKKASASATAKLKKVTHNVTPGKLRYFSLKYTPALKGALADLAPGKKLKLKITASAKNVAGQVSKDKTTVQLKGN